jgi:hypothetical protein
MANSCATLCVLSRIIFIGGFLTALVFIANIFQALCIPLLLISKDAYRSAEGFVVESFIGTCCLVLRFGGGIHLYFIGKPDIVGKLMERRPFSLLQNYSKVDDGLDNILILSNHVSFVDWWIIYFIALRVGTARFVRFVTKEAIKFIPGLGFAAYFHDFLFVKRDWKTDQVRIKRFIEDFVISRVHHIWICIFPEGTFVDSGEEKVVDASQKFMRDNYPGMNPFNYVLFPKAKGFEAITRASNLKSILNLTWIYSFKNGTHTACPLLETGKTRKIPSTIDLISNPPEAVYIHASLEEYDNSVDTREWLKDRFQEKEVILKTFNETKMFSKDVISIKDTKSPTAEMLVHLLFWIILICFILVNIVVKYFFASSIFFSILIFVGIFFLRR